MNYYIKRSRYAIKRRLGWMALAVVPLFVYLLGAAMSPDRFTVAQDIRISRDAPISVANSPIEVTKLSDMVVRSDDFFKEDFALAELSKRLESINLAADPDRQTRALKVAAAKVMSLQARDENTIRIVYYGEDLKLGEALVDFFSQRLLERAEDGTTRSHRWAAGPSGSLGRSGEPAAMLASRAGSDSATDSPAQNQLGINRRKDATSSTPGGQTISESPQAPGLTGGKILEQHRALWRPERLVPSVTILFISLCIMLLTLITLEWMDPSFKSERQVARYLGVPILGSLPNLEKLAQATKSR